MSTKANLIEHVIVGEYGYPVYLHLIDEKSVDVPINGYDTFQVILRSPDKLKTVTYTATLYSDGIDGKLYFIPASTDIDRSGKWQGMVQLTDTSTAVSKSEIFDMIVQDSL